MANVYTPNTVKVCMRFLQNGENTCNVYYVDVGQEPTESILRDVSDIFKLWFETDLKQHVQGNTSLQAMEVTDWSAEGQEGIVDTTDLPSSGTMTGNPMPNNSTVVIKAASGYTGRSKRGRKYHVGLSDGQLATGQQSINPSIQNALQSAYQALLDALESAAFAWVINSIWHNGVQRTVGVNTPVTDISVNPTLDSQRRRLPERGT